MGIVVVPTYGSDPATVTAANLDAKVAGLATEFNGNIDDNNIKLGAAIANSKVNLATISQAVTATGGLTVSTTAQTMTSIAINEAKGADIASATTPNITTATGNMVHITGTTTITGFATGQAGIRRVLVFDGILTFTHNATSLILPTGANITTAANDTCVMVSEGSGNWRCASYQRKDGSALVPFTPSATNALSGSVIQSLTTATGAVITGTALIPFDDTTPLQAGPEGFEVTTQAITASSASNFFEISGSVMASPNGSSSVTVCIYQDSTSAAIKAMGGTFIAAGEVGVIPIYHKMTTGTTSATTFKIWVGQKDSGTLTVNGVGGARIYGGIAGSYINVKEIKA